MRDRRFATRDVQRGRFDHHEPPLARSSRALSQRVVKELIRRAIVGRADCADAAAARSRASVRVEPASGVRAVVPPRDNRDDPQDEIVIAGETSSLFVHKSREPSADVAEAHEDQVQCHCGSRNAECGSISD